MKKTKGARWILLVTITAFVATGCAGFGKGMSEADKAAQAIAAAKAANNRAKAVDYLWRDAGKMIKKAEAALKAEDYAKAIKWANKAKNQGEIAVMQERSERARLAGMFGTGGGGSGADSYTVVRGDSLWGISGKPSVYNNPYQWPLIYKANSGKIKDADLIYPGQSLSIGRSWSSSDIDAAVQHAKSRGAWSVGVTEDSDMSYLAR